MSIININSFKELQSEISQKEKSYLLLYKSGSENSDCAYNNLLEAGEQSNNNIFVADVNNVRDIHTNYSITAVPTLLEFEKSGANREMTPEEEINLLSSAAKKRKESIEQFRNAERHELADKEESELKIINAYLPKQLTDEEILIEIKKIAEEVGAFTKTDFPKLMPVAAKKLKGKADGRKIKELVDKLLMEN